MSHAETASTLFEQCVKHIEMISKLKAALAPFAGARDVDGLTGRVSITVSVAAVEAAQKLLSE